MIVSLHHSDELRAAVVESGLLSSATLAAVPDESELAVELARWMVRERLLTPFQARTLLSGEPFQFFLSERYKILESLGKGGMGQVYLAEHLLLRRVVATKVILTSPQTVQQGAIDRFFREARAVAVLDHPNVVRVFDMAVAALGPFIVMEYVDGTSLHAITARFGPLSVPRAVDAVVQTAAGLEHAHASGLIHRDVKPGNLLLDRMGTVKVVDLGLARFRDVTENHGLTGLHDANRIIGTVEYQAPEQAMDSGSADARSDIYSLGATLFHLLTGRPPFPAGTLQNKLLAHQLKVPPLTSSVNPAVPAPLAELVAAMMAKRPTDRPQSMADVRQLLAPWRSDSLPLPTPQEMPKHPPSAYRLGLTGSPQEFVASEGTGSITFGFGSGPPVSPRNLGPLPLSAGSAMLPPRLRPQEAPISAPMSKSEATQADDSQPSSGSPAAPARAISRRAIILGVGGGIAGSVLAAWAYSYWTRPTIVPVPVPPVVPISPPTPPPSSFEITGAGSTFIKPAMDEWVKAYAASTGGKVEYRGGGSKFGIDSVLNGSVLFACSDVPVQPAQLRGFGLDPGDLFHLPLALGAVVPIYNLPDLPAGKKVQLTGAVLAEIFSGGITKWNHEALKACNPHLSENLPNLPITVIVRREGSGTTAVFTDYLAKISPRFKQSVGTGDVVQWGVSEENREQGNDKLTARVKKTVGAIGYTELANALREVVPFGAVKNEYGNMIDASPETITAAAAGKQDIPDELTFSLTDVKAEKAYPICLCTWAVVRKRLTRGGAVAEEELKKFLRWVVQDGQRFLTSLKYAPLPPALVKRTQEKINAITAG